MKIVTADLVPSGTFHDLPDFWETSGVEYRMYSKHQGSNIKALLLYVGPKGACRREFGGDELPGPYAGVVTLPWVIAAYAERSQPRVEKLEPGDVVVFRGEPMELCDDKPGSDPYFLPIPKPWGRRLDARVALGGFQQGAFTIETDGVEHPQAFPAREVFSGPLDALEAVLDYADKLRAGPLHLDHSAVAHELERLVAENLAE